jgi:hypothetical protein
MTSALRRWSSAAILAALAAVVAAWFRHREPEVLDDVVPGTAAWPPLAPLSTVPLSTPVIKEPTDGAAADPVDPPADDLPAPEHPETPWVASDGAGGCPFSHPVKVKERSGIYHVPGGLAYGRTNADRCYLDAAAAEADGFRAAKR